MWYAPYFIYPNHWRPLAATPSMMYSQSELRSAAKKGAHPPQEPPLLAPLLCCAIPLHYGTNDAYSATDVTVHRSRAATTSFTTTQGSSLNPVGGSSGPLELAEQGISAGQYVWYRDGTVRWKWLWVSFLVYMGYAMLYW